MEEAGAFIIGISKLCTAFSNCKGMNELESALAKLFGFRSVMEKLSKASSILVMAPASEGV
jgi:hypothetical protein